jgi:sarcosine oxidase
MSSLQSQSNTSFDVIVIGVGSMGSSACYHLATRGCKVLGLEQFDISHEFGSHAGQSRIIRKAYFENSDYVPLLTRAYENWKALEEETGEQLYFKTGLVYFGNPDHVMMQGVKQSASLYSIPLENFTGSSINQRFPQFTIPANFEGLWESEAGFVTPEKAIQLYAKQAIRKRAEIHSNEKILNWKKNGNGVIVTSDKNTYRSQKLVITAGAWSKSMIPGLSRILKITRQFVAWIKPNRWNDFTLDHFPCWLIADEKQGCYYGFPILPKAFGDPQGLKLAHHYPALETDPDNVNRKINAEDETDLQYVLDRYFPGVFESLLSYKICLYANSPDEDFIIDNLPGYEENVAIACGFSGHGFKFASVVGEIVADLVTAGKAKLPVKFLSVNRFLS